MKIFRPKQNRALTLIEVLLVLAVLFIMAAMLLPKLAQSPHRVPYIQCVNNLKQTGLAFRIWAGDNNDRYPMEVSLTNGGGMELTAGPYAFRHFQVMSNELSTPKVLFCPAESDSFRFVATNFINFNNSNISFFAGIAANQSRPRMILSGDHNLTNGTPIRNNMLDLVTNLPTRWTDEVHKNLGNICLADGSVKWNAKPVDLSVLIENSGVATNRLQMP